MNEYEKAQALILAIKNHKITQYRVSKETGIPAPGIKIYRENEERLMNATYRNIKKLADGYDQLQDTFKK